MVGAADDVSMVHHELQSKQKPQKVNFLSACWLQIIEFYGRRFATN
jgi:hypothetical protein